MLTLKNITKSYTTNDFNQVALNDVSISFREKEFVSILGPSGSGKTTMLNIIGGLDKYDSGDLIINHKSTKKYKDKDWDSYRNHSIGFVFQSYNLIPHQSVLANVELALTLSGISKKKRTAAAISALEKVGLKDHIYKKPNQLSGGQMQRVAIARAIINDPEIILADEPTGALDSETSVQIMEILKELSKDKLVIMVTHNPDLAEEYSNRIVRVKDGAIINDTNPYDVKDDDVKQEKTKKTSMNFWTAIALSFNNLLTKKGRTTLTSFAGSIGIIGIALILAISNGVQLYIDSVQQDTLSSYPVQIESTSTDASALLTSLMGVDANGQSTNIHEKDAVYANPVMYKMLKTLLTSSTKKNDMQGLKTFLEEHKDEIDKHTIAMQYSYDIDLNVYTKESTGKYIKSDFLTLMQKTIDGGGFINSMTSTMSKMGGLNIWQELINDPSTNQVSSLITDQYDLVYGKYPEKENELLLVLTENNEISDITLYALGLVDQQTMMKSTMAAIEGKEDKSFDDIIGKSWSYEHICNIPLKLVLPTDTYQYDEESGKWKDVSNNEVLMDSIIEKGLELKISGIVRPNGEAMANVLTGSLCYSPALTKYYAAKTLESGVIKAQMENKDTNVLNGLPFSIANEENMSDADKVKFVNDYVAKLGAHERVELYEKILSKVDNEEVNKQVDDVLSMYDNKDAEFIVKDIATNYASSFGYSGELLTDMLSGYTKEELLDILKQSVKDMIVEQKKAEAQEQLITISKTPSSDEVKQIRDMFTKQLYSQPGIPQQQVQLGFVASKWVEKTGMSQEAATMQLMQVMTTQPQEFTKLFEKELNEEILKIYAENHMGAQIDDKKASEAFDAYFKKLTDKEKVELFNDKTVSGTSSKTYDELLSSLGFIDEKDPSRIAIYPKDFAAKDEVTKLIKQFNEGKEKEGQIEYVDIAAILISSVQGILTAITTVLICFVSISLIVSSIMVGIITYVSVIERTKEIGVLRALGASKKGVARVFMAETSLIGLAAGVIGVLVTVLLCIPLSMIAQHVTGISDLNAILPPAGYLLIAVSVFLTLIAGVVPSRIAAKKSPVECLRSE